MKRIQTILQQISSQRIWFIALACVELFFIIFAWLSYAESFDRLVGLMLCVSLAGFVIPLTIQLRQQQKQHDAFHRFLLEPNEANEYLLCEVTPPIYHSYIHELGKHFRQQQAAMDDCCLQLADYESYIETWVHEIKKPLSLMTLLLDNRKEEMSPLVRTRMLHVGNQVRKDVEQILYFSRLGAAHKDYFWEQLPLLSLCRESVEDNVSLLDEADFSTEFSGEDLPVVSDKKGLMFIIEQLISNSVKYANQQTKPSLRFEVKEKSSSEEIILSISDNGPGISPSDIPFVFDKGFTGDQGSYLSRSTGMGLFLVSKMAHDLAIHGQVESSLYHGTTMSLVFPKITHSDRRTADEST